LELQAKSPRTRDVNLLTLHWRVPSASGWHRKQTHIHTYIYGCLLKNVVLRFAGSVGCICLLSPCTGFASCASTQTCVYTCRHASAHTSAHTYIHAQHTYTHTRNIRTYIHINLRCNQCGDICLRLCVLVSFEGIIFLCQQAYHAVRPVFMSGDHNSLKHQVHVGTNKTDARLSIEELERLLVQEPGPWTPTLVQQCFTNLFHASRKRKGVPGVPGVPRVLRALARKVASWQGSFTGDGLSRIINSLSEMSGGKTGFSGVDPKG
jgi:hypothetical protein